ncbi:ABC transporter permease [Lactobacillus sp. ESL0679]|uniref:ABC transporter permease n=1 Tax=Lactobacillus sp. ESL0679 TaxID=2983209 RepID=UPI0023F86E7F|nr:ABC transporter permease [Lactobacillus sp. ESL0679]MDF7683014.1 ABC transporter permease [Lactobacillus sp. ESL0679]
MIRSLKEEIYKFIHQKTSLYGLVALVLLMIYSALTSKTNADSLISIFGAIEWIPIILIAIGSAFFAMEYSNNTILLLLYKNSERSEIYIAKFLTILLYGIVLTATAIITAFLLSIVLQSRQYNLFTVIAGKTILIQLGLNILGMIIYSLFAVAMSFMLIMLIRVNAVVICIGLAWGFFGASLSTALMKTFPTISNILKWNPLNMVFISQQLSKPYYYRVSQLSNSQLIMGTLFYSLFFAILGYLLFRQRRV